MKALALGVLGGGALGTCVMAQAINSGANAGPSQNLSTPAPKHTDASTPEVEHLLGDWGGVRTYLGDLGINLVLDDTNEFGANVSGGTKRAQTNAGQVALQADVNWEKLAGIGGFSTHTAIVGRYGANLSGIFGDQLSPVQEIYGAGGNVVAHLVHFYGEKSALNGRLNVAAGRMSVGSDFAASPLYCNFMNNALCGNPKALSGNIGGFVAWPDSVWGARARVRPTSDTYVQIGAYEVNPNVYGNRAGFRSGWAIDSSKDSGVEVPAEFAWQPGIGRDALAGHYKLGLAYDSSSYPIFGQDVRGGVPELTGLAQQRRRGRLQYWALADQMLVRNGPGSDEGLFLLAGYVHDDPATFVRGDEVFAGLVNRGFWRARPQDSVGFLFSYQWISDLLRRQQGLDLALGLPIANSATGIQTTEAIFELNYDIHVGRGVDFEPDIQYIVRPNAQSNIPSALVIGFKSHVSF